MSAPERDNSNGDKTPSDRERREESPLIDVSDDETRDEEENTPRPRTPPLPEAEKDEDEDQENRSRKRSRGGEYISERPAPTIRPQARQTPQTSFTVRPEPLVPWRPNHRPLSAIARPFFQPSPPTHQPPINTWRTPYSQRPPLQAPPFDPAQVNSLADELARTLEIFQGSMQRVHHTIEALQQFSAGIYHATSYPPPQPLAPRPLLQRMDERWSRPPSQPVLYSSGFQSSQPGPSRLIAPAPSPPRPSIPPQSKRTELNRKRRARKRKTDLSHKGKGKPRAEVQDDDAEDEAEDENEKDKE